MSSIVRDATLVPEGDGVNVKRLFPLHGFMNFDPFVLWDHFDIGAGRGFPDHPHRGFEGVTYMFSGGMQHKDNLGNASFVETGGAQRFTAGKGIVHSEMPADEGLSNGIQLWVNLPIKLKKIEPSYQQVNASEFPSHTFEGGKVKYIIGNKSPLKLNTEVIYQHIELDSEASYKIEIKNEMRGIIYVLNGQIRVNSYEALNAAQALFIDVGETLEFTALANSEFMICMGVPYKEPIHQHGPFVD